MAQILGITIAILISYLIGSLPTAFLFSKIIKGIDIRKFGSGNVGATNAFRLLGPLPGICILLIDISKGIIPTTLLADYFLATHLISFKNILFLKFIMGLAVVAGHNWPIFLRFRGGKGVATSLGVLIGLGVASFAFRQILLTVTLVWLLSFVFSKYVSLASIIASGVFPVLVFLFIGDFALFCLSLIFGIFVIYKHKSNIYRMLRKEEPRVRFFCPKS